MELNQLKALALAHGEGVAQLEGAGIDVVALGSHGLAVDLDAAAVDIATSLAGARRKIQVLEQASEVDLALVVDGQLNVFLGEVGELALLEHAVELGLSLVSGAGAGDEAQAEFDRVFKEGQLADFPEKHVELTVNDEGQIYLAGLLKDLDLSASAGQARRDIDGGGVKINGKAVAPKSYNIDPSALKLGDTLSVGKRKGFKLI